MKASVLCVYNEGSRPNTSYIGAKGFSVMVEVDGERTLFGTGLRGRYLVHNMEHLRLDADSISRVVISHGHADHARGISALLDIRKGPLPIYAPADAWGGRGMLSKDGIALTDKAAPKAERKDVTGWTQLSKHLFLTPPLEAGGVSETFLVLAGGSRPVLISGCCHCGIDAALGTVREKFGYYPRSLIGGLHLEKVPKEMSYAVAETLRNAECQDLNLNHCTGPKGALRLREKLSLEGVKEYNVGDILEYELGLM
jgi:7,8-dihydropterin-6-yl-methyl-4-(beta-D-ribofuranosyl)aminobenzene 5'-phosphate synthase